MLVDDVLVPDAEELRHIGSQIVNWEREDYEVFDWNDKQLDALLGHWRCLYFAGANQIGKSFVQRFRAAMHLTGLYPRWYLEAGGLTFDHPIVSIQASRSSIMTRNIMAWPLLGMYGDYGSGMIPRDCVDPESIKHISGPGNIPDIAKVKHFNYKTGAFDGYSLIHFKCHAQRKERLAAIAAHHVDVDEEPTDYTIQSELEARMQSFEHATLMIAATPEFGFSPIYCKFDENENPDYHMIHYGVPDAKHLTEKARQRIMDRWKGMPDERPKCYGYASLGEGALYPYDDHDLYWDIPDEIPPNWRWIIGIDLPHGEGHFAAVKCCYDPDLDVLYVVAEYREKAKPRYEYIEALRAMGGETIPIAWPKDGYNKLGGEGVALIEPYRDAHLNILPDWSGYELEAVGHGVGKMIKKKGKTNSLSRVVQDTADRMATGRIKVNRFCKKWYREKANYRGKAGYPLPRQMDHLLDATHKAVMMLRHSKRLGGKGSSTWDGPTTMDFNVFGF